MHGIVAGGMTWAVAVVLGGLFGTALGESMIVRLGSAGAWSAFLGMSLGLGAAMIGGMLGATRGYPVSSDVAMPAAPREAAAHAGSLQLGPAVDRSTSLGHAAPRGR